MDELQQIRTQLEAGQPVKAIAVYEFLHLFGQERRGYKVVSRIRELLNKYKLATVPDFENEHYYNQIRIVMADAPAAPAVATKNGGAAGPVPAPEPPIAPPVEVVPETPSKEPRDAVVTIRQGIPAAGQAPATVRPEELVSKALTRLMDERLSHLIVQKGDRARVEGVFSYESFSHAHLAGKQPKQVSDCMSHEFIEVNEEKPLIDAVRDIIQHGTVVVRSSQNQLCGVVTARDVACVFVELAEPYLLLGQIENHLRALMEKSKFTKEDYSSFVVETDPERKAKAEEPDDLTLGELIVAFEKDDAWKKVGLQFDKATFTKRLHSVRDIRNKVMHFSPDGLPPENVEMLKNTRQLLEKL